MKATLMDPRNPGHRDDCPRYMVSFWESDESRGLVETSWELREADIDDVLAWIDENSDGRSHSLWVLFHDGRNECYARLRGRDLDGEDAFPPWSSITRAQSRRKA